MHVLIIHGAYGHPGENWIPWLSTKLQEQGHQVIVPHFPTPEGQTLNSWIEVVEEHFEALNFGRDMVVVGHSIGGAFALRLAERALVPFRGTFIISGFVGALHRPEFDTLNESFFESTFDWERIIQFAGQISLFYSTNDPYLSQSKASELAQWLRITPLVVENAGHFNEAAGYRTFPLLLQEIQQLNPG